jgi:hypothetical protein
MATLPRATTTVSATAGAGASGIDTLCIWAPVPLNADAVPRQYGTAAAIYAKHGYSDGLELAALHFARAGKPVIFQGLPIVTDGAVSRHDTSGNTGTCVTTVTAATGGVLGEHDGVLTVVIGGTIGTSQIKLSLSLDGGTSYQTIKLGTANSYTVPYFGVVVAFGAGTLVAGDVIHTWHGSSPQPDATGLALAREKLAAQPKPCRSIVRVPDCLDNTAAAAFVTQLNALETSNERFVQGRASVVDRLPQAAMSLISERMTGAPTLTIAIDNTVTRSAGSWITDGFVTGDTVTLSGTSSNNITRIATVTSATVLTLGGAALSAETAAAAMVVGSPTIAFAEVGDPGDTITRSRGSWLMDGFRAGDLITVEGSVGNNISAAAVTDVTATVLTLGSTDLLSESIESSAISVAAGQTKVDWMTAIETEYATIATEPRIDLSAGRGRVVSPFNGWSLRRPVAWAASCREYQHDLHVSTWYKALGNVGFSLYDTDGQLVEWDDRVDGGAGSAAGFTTFRTYANGPAGAYITQSLTRAAEGSVQAYTHNMHVINLACTTVQNVTENFIGRSLVLNRDGTATSDSLSTLQSEVNAALELALLTNRGEGPRASSVLWTPSADDILNVPEAELNGVVELNLNGTLHSVNTVVRVLSGGNS